jgi:hypothetical protein
MYTHRALVTYSNERTGEIRVKVPAVTGKAELSISYIGRHKFNGIWVVPDIGEQIAVSADDEELTNLFWVHTDGYKYTKNYRNYASYLSTTPQTISLSHPTKRVPITFSHIDSEKGIKLVDNSKITFEYAGRYNLQYSIQWENRENKINESVVWLEYVSETYPSGIYYPNSATYVSIPNSHGGGYGKTVTSVNFFGQAEVGGYVRLWWATSAPQLVYIQTIISDEVGFPPLILSPNPPPPIPDAPGIIVTIDQIA